MNSRSALNQVKVQVRQEALARRVFSVDAVVRATGLNPESVRTELQRMKEQGLLTSERQGRQCQYSLTDDPEMRLALSQSLRAFQPSVIDASALPVAGYPASDAYTQAQHCLDTAMNASEEERSPLLTEAKKLIEQAEGYVSASEAALSYLGYERARLAYLLGRHEAAERSFQALRPFFESIRDADMVGCIDEFLVVIRNLEANRVDFAAGGPARELREYLRSHRSRGPLLPRLIDMLEPTLDAPHGPATPASLGLSHVADFLGEENLLIKGNQSSRTAALAA